MKHHRNEEEDDFRERARKEKKAKEERGRFKFPVGETTFRILKTPQDKELGSPSVFMYYRIHRDIGPKNGFGRCGKDIDGQGECWLCDTLIPKLQKKGKTKTAAKLEAAGNFVLQLAVVDSESGEWRGPLLFTTGEGKSAKSMSYLMESLIQNTKRDYVSHTDGYNVTLERTGTGKNDTRYGTPVGDDEATDVPKEIVKRLKPFETVLPQYDEEQLKAFYFGREYEPTEAEEEEQEEKPRKPARKPKEEEEEEEQEEESEEESESEEETEEEESEEEEKIKSKKKPAKKAKREEEEETEEEEESEEGESEEEEETEEEEEEEPEPKKPPKKKKR